MPRTLTALEVQQYVAPEYDGVDLAVIEDVIEEAVAFTNEAAWGSEKRYNTALKYLTLHLLSRYFQAQGGAGGGTPGSGGGASPGAVKWIQADTHQIGYATAPSSSGSGGGGVGSEWLNSTEWGQRYLFLSYRNFADRVI